MTNIANYIIAGTHRTNCESWSYTSIHTFQHTYSTAVNDLDKLQQYILAADGEVGGEIKLRQRRLIDNGTTHEVLWGHVINLLIETKRVSQMAMHEVRNRDKYQRG